MLWLATTKKLGRREMVRGLTDDPLTTVLTLKVTVIIEQDGELFHAYCPGLKGLHVSGASKEETLENAKDAVLAYLDSLQKAGEPIPVGPDLTIAREGAFPEVPAWMVHQITLQWPSPNMSGTR